MAEAADGAESIDAAAGVDSQCAGSPITRARKNLAALEALAAAEERGRATAAEITVTMDSGRSTVYTLTVTRKEAVPLTVTHDTGVSVQIYNSAGAEIGKDDNGTYPLTPGDDSYTYIATKNTYYHTKGTFAAPTDGDTALTIAAVTPETEDHLTSLKLTSGTRSAFSTMWPPIWTRWKR